MNENLSIAPNELEKLNIMSFLNDLLHRLRSFWWIILLLTVLGGAAFYYRTSTTYTPSYTAEATVSVEIVNIGQPEYGRTIGHGFSLYSDQRRPLRRDRC